MGNTVLDSTRLDSTINEHGISLIVNQTLSTGIFPRKPKTAKAIPVYKKNDKTLLKNYRPISVLPVVSKLLKMLCTIK